MFPGLQSLFPPPESNFTKGHRGRQAPHWHQHVRLQCKCDSQLSILHVVPAVQRVTGLRLCVCASGAWRLEEGWSHAAAGWAARLQTVCHRHWRRQREPQTQPGLRGQPLQQISSTDQTWKCRPGLGPVGRWVSIMTFQHDANDYNLCFMQSKRLVRTPGFYWTSWNYYLFCDQGETREERTFRNWMNSLGVNPHVNHLYGYVALTHHSSSEVCI